jgi:DNA-binding NarL/FixJ family response regulator
VAAQGDGWTMELYNPSRSACEAPASKDSPAHPDRRDGPIRGIPPDIVLISLTGRADSHLRCVRRLKARAPDVPVLLIGGRRHFASAAQYCLAGGDGWLSKPLSPAKVARAIRAAAQGEPVFSREAQNALVRYLHKLGKTLASQSLTPRQQQILGSLEEGLQNKEIAQRLGISPHTVHVQVARLLRRFHAHTRKQLVKSLVGGGAGSAGCSPSVTHFRRWLVWAEGIKIGPWLW